MYYDIQEIEVYVLGGLLVGFEVKLDRDGDLIDFKPTTINGTDKGALDWITRRLSADDRETVWEAAYHKWIDDGNQPTDPATLYA